MLGSLVLAWIFICLLFLFIRIQRPKNFPPGPRPVPIFGNLIQLNITNPLKDFEKRGGDRSSFDEGQLVRYIIDLHVAGTDTTSNTLLTVLPAAMARHAFNFLFLERCQKEIDEVLEGKAHASFEDRLKMPYTQAVIHECQRVANTVPLSVFHCTSRDTELMGYSIPKGTLIILNLASVLSEEGQWKFPHEFMVTLLRQFRFFCPEDAREPDFTPVYGITLTPKPYRMGVRLRQTATI